MVVVKLQSSDGENFSIDAPVARKMDIFKQMLDDMELNGVQEEIIPLPNIDAKTLKPLIEWATEHKDDPPRPSESQRKAQTIFHISPWDENFLKVNKNLLIDMMHSSHFLEMEELHELVCKNVIQHFIKDKSPHEIRASFHIENDLTPKEEEEIKKQGEWCVEKKVVPMQSVAQSQQSVPSNPTLPIEPLVSIVESEPYKPSFFQ